MKNILGTETGAFLKKSGNLFKYTYYCINIFLYFITWIIINNVKKQLITVQHVQPSIYSVVMLFSVTFNLSGRPR